MLFGWKEKPQTLQNTAAQTSYCRLIKKMQKMWARLQLISKTCISLEYKVKCRSMHQCATAYVKKSSHRSILTPDSKGMRGTYLCNIVNKKHSENTNLITHLICSSYFKGKILYCVCVCACIHFVSFVLSKHFGVLTD